MLLRTSRPAMRGVFEGVRARQEAKLATSEKRRVAVAAFSQTDELEEDLSELALAGIQNEHLCLLVREGALSNLAGGGTGLHLSEIANGLSPVGSDENARPLLVSGGRNIHRMLGTPENGQGVAERLSTWIPMRQSRSLETSLETGAALLWVCISDDDLEQTVPEILLRHSAQPVQVHEVSA